MGDAKRRGTALERTLKGVQQLTVQVDELAPHSTYDALEALQKAIGTRTVRTPPPLPPGVQGFHLGPVRVLRAYQMPTIQDGQNVPELLITRIDVLVK